MGTIFDDILDEEIEHVVDIPEWLDEPIVEPVEEPWPVDLPIPEYGPVEEEEMMFPANGERQSTEFLQGEP